MMRKRKPKVDINGGRLKRPAEYRILSNRILECAGNGIQRAQFLKEVSQMLIDFVDCDVVRLVLRDRGWSYRCEITDDSSQPFRFDATLDPLDKDTENVWSSGENKALEQLCRNIVYMRIDQSASWFTDNGSFWTDDIDSVGIPSLRQLSRDSGTGIRIDKNCRSLALIPIESGQERIGLVQLVSDTETAFTEHEIDSLERLAQTIGVALTQRRLQVALRERVKELTCLYGIAQLVAQPDISLDELMQKTVNLLPPAWLYPDIATARIILDDNTFRTASYQKAIQSMKTDIVVHGKMRGSIEVGYVWEKPQLDEGPFLTEERHLINAVAHEVSVIIEQRQAQAEKEKLQEQLRHADRLATIGQLGAGLAHELNEPLANILGFAQLACKDNGLTGQTRQDIEKIVTAALHAREVIAKLLVFARHTTSEKTQVDINNLVENGLHFLQSRCAKAGIDLLRNLSSDLPQITADNSQLLQVLTNLIVNSVQAMPRGGRLTISTSCDDGHIVLAVEDTGIGMSSDVMKNAFDPFFTTKDVDEGTGLGLSVVHGIVTSHGGTIEIESEAGQGTKFIVRLPVETSAPGRERDNG